MTTHSNIGASSAKRVMGCPGSVSLAETVPPLPESEYASLGTAKHAAMEMVMTRQVEYIEDLLGLTLHGAAVTEDFLEEIFLANLAFASLNSLKGRATYLTERKVHINTIEGAYGTPDVVGVFTAPEPAPTGFIVDWKFGSGVPVPVKDNAQLLFGMLGAIDTYPDMFKDVQRFKLVIIQPPLYDDVPEVWEIDRERLEQFRLEYAMAVRLTKGDNPRIEAGDWCRWCPAKPLCPLKVGAAKDAVGTNIADLNSDEIGALVTLSLDLENWGKDVRALAHEMLENGKAVTGYKLIAKRATRSWANEANTVAALRKLRLRVMDLYPKKLISPAQAEKILKAKGKTVPEELIQAISSGTTLALESHKAPAVMSGRKALKALGDRLKTL